MMMQKIRQAVCALLLVLPLAEAFSAAPPAALVSARSAMQQSPSAQQRTAPLQAAETDLDAVTDAVVAPLKAVVADVGIIPPLQTSVPGLDTIALVAGQENYGLAVVVIGEALWSFSQAPSFDHAKVLVPAVVAALVLCLVSGPMVTSGDPAAVSTGLFIATGVSLGLGASYVARLLAPFSPSSKEIAALGLLVAVAGFFSFSQNLVVDGFVTLPSIPLPTLPEISLPSIGF